MLLPEEIRVRCIVVAALLSIGAGCSPGDATRSESSIPLLDLDNQQLDFSKLSLDRIVVAVFARSDCPISNRFAPEIRDLCERYGPRGVDFYLVYVDPLEEPQAIRRHLEEYKYPCQGLRDLEHKLVSHCQATITPEAAVFDRNRNIAYVGRINDLYTELGTARPEPTTHDLADAIESTLSSQPAQSVRTKAIGCPIADLAN
jgi:hypothetical protein